MTNRDKKSTGRGKKPAANPFLQGKTIKQLLPYWPNLMWVCSDPASSTVRPDPKEAVLKKAESVAGHLRIAMKQGGKEFAAIVPVTEDNVREMIRQALTKSIGKTIGETGAEKV